LFHETDIVRVYDNPHCYVRHDSFIWVIYETWLIDKCDVWDMTDLKVIRETWLEEMSPTYISVCLSTFSLTCINVTLLWPDANRFWGARVHIYAAIHSYGRHDSFLFVPRVARRKVDICDTTLLCIRYHPFILSHDSLIRVPWYDSFRCVPWQIDIGDMTYFCHICHTDVWQINYVSHQWLDSKGLSASCFQPTFCVLRLPIAPLALL